MAKLIPYKRGNVIRPFLISDKSELEKWCKNNKVPFIIDPSNADVSYTRNYIRHELMPKALHVNPGLLKILKKRVREAFIEQQKGKTNAL